MKKNGAMENNFNIIKLITAIAVLFAHCDPILYGRNNQIDWLSRVSGDVGYVAVDIFFCISGYLVTKSIILRDSLSHYIFSRLLRIYPALIVMLVIVVFLMGPIVSSLPIDAYLTNTMTYNYFLKCIFIIKGMAYELPGVFSENPLHAVNGSLWSIHKEVVFYIILGCLWISWRLFIRKVGVDFGQVILVMMVLTAALLASTGIEPAWWAGSAHLMFIFLEGSALYLVFHQDRKLVFIMACLLSFILIGYFLSIDFAAYNLFLPLIVLSLAYWRPKFFSRISPKGDYSYGFYIYAFPVQQMVVLYFPEINYAEFFGASLCITMSLAFFSWHMVEKKFSNMKNNLLWKHGN